ncbi:MFS transporter [Micromonospora echinospora]|uniref:MFS transporter n=1 Tax=Micromonospora echinospora TaxID=1877 RepID=UPI0033FC72F9
MTQSRAITPPPNGPAEPRQRNSWAVVLTAGLISFLVMLEINVVHVALPVIQRELGTTQGVTQWVAVGYLLPAVILVLPCGRWLDQIDRRTAYAFAVGGFGLTSLAAGLAPGIETLITARVLQGVFASLIFAMAPALAALAVRADTQGRAMSVIATMGPLGAITGPSLGGFLLDTIGWRAAFLVVVPVCAVVLPIGLRTIPTTGKAFRPPDREWLVAAGLIAVSVGALLGGISLAPDRGPAWVLLSLLAVPALLVWHRLGTNRPVLDLLRTREISVAALAIVTGSLGYAMLAFIVPYFLLQVLDTSAAVAGLTVLAYPLAMAVFAPLGGTLADRWAPGPVALVGALLVATSVLLVQPLASDWGPVDLAWRLAVGGAGTALFGGPVQAMAMRAAPRPLAATAAGTLQSGRMLGFTLGPAVATAVWAASGHSVPGMRNALTTSLTVATLAAVVLAAGLLLTARRARPAVASAVAEPIEVMPEKALD